MSKQATSKKVTPQQLNNHKITNKRQALKDLKNMNWGLEFRNTAQKRGKINTPSSSQVVQPLYKSSISKWKNYEKYFANSKKYLYKWEDYFKY